MIKTAGSAWPAPEVPVTQRLPVLAFFSLLSSPLLAHHSFAPHFDASKPVDISGTIIQFEQRNPHAYLHVRAEDGDGRLRDWVCESHGVTQLSRNGITPDLLAEGQSVRIQGSQHRRDPLQCFFDVVHLPDGRTLSVNGPRGADSQAPALARRDSLFGTWLIVPANRSTSGPQEMMAYLTPDGEAAVAAYDPFRDDPSFRCEPVAVRRGWFAPGTPMAIRQEGQNIVIQHEWMDIERLVHLDQDSIPAGTEPSILGYSIGRMEGDTLVVETGAYLPGVLNQYVEEAGQPTRGLLHSEELRTVERLRFNADTQRVELAIEHYDPKFFTRDFPVARAEFAPTELEIKPFGCIPQQLK